MEKNQSSSTAAGRDVAIGQTIKDKGRWYTVVRWVKNPLWDDTDMRVAEATDARGEEKCVSIFDGDIYPLRTAGQAAPVLITVRDWREGGRDVTIEIRYRKRSYGGWDVVRADNGRLLGWLYQGHGERDWDAYVSSSAFRGASADDTGHSLDYVPFYLFNGRSEAESNRIGLDSKRDGAAELIVHRLVDKGAPAAGFGAHYDVHHWADR
jgi:hypothetical protein